jgi:hypothetical protein
VFGRRPVLEQRLGGQQDEHRVDATFTPKEPALAAFEKSMRRR